MPVSGLVITLTDRPESRASALAGIEAQPGLTVGSVVGSHLPVVIEAVTAEGCKQIAERLLALSGVEFVNVVSVDFSDED